MSGTREVADMPAEVDFSEGRFKWVAGQPRRSFNTKLGLYKKVRTFFWDKQGHNEERLVEAAYDAVAAIDQRNISPMARERGRTKGCP